MKLITTSSSAIKGTIIYLPIFEDTKPSHPHIKFADENTQSQASKILKSKEFTPKKNNLYQFHTGKKSPERLILIGLGKKQSQNHDAYRHAAATAARHANTHKQTEITFVLPELEKEESATKIAAAIAEGATMGLYEITGYKSEKPEKQTLKTITLTTPEKSIEKDLEAGLKSGSIIGEAVATARDLANAPSNELTPESFKTKAQKLAATHKPLSLQIIDKKKAQELGMNGLLGVAKGSQYSPYLLIFKYNGAPKSEKPVALIGKGVTFDSGGISIKPSKGMSEMKGDMGGAAAVFGAIEAIARLKPKINVLGIIPAVENMPSGTALKPGDIITMSNGKTVEITNTDAEGRLILADALAWATKQNPKYMIDLATLTGACLVALGDQASAILGNNDKLIESLKTAAEYTGERLWQLPLYDEYFGYLKSDIADMINANENRLAGTSSAAKFLEQFVGETPWAHIDIASTMSYDKTKGYEVGGMSGSNVRNLVEFITSL